MSGHAQLAACSYVTSPTCMLLLFQDYTQGCLDVQTLQDKLAVREPHAVGHGHGLQALFRIK